jgi:hypothetical protein
MRRKHPLAAKRAPVRNAPQTVMDGRKLYSVRGKGKIVGPELAPEYLAAAAGSPVVMKGAEQFGTKGREQPFEWGDEQIWPGLAPEQREAVVELLEEFRESFAWSIHNLSNTYD